MKHLDTLRDYGNLSSHHQTGEPLNPWEIWKTIEVPFRKVAEWILVEVLSVDIDALSEPYTVEQLIETGIITQIQNLGSKRLDDDHALLNFENIWKDDSIQKSFKA